MSDSRGVRGPARERLWDGCGIVIPREHGADTAAAQGVQGFRVLLPIPSGHHTTLCHYSCTIPQRYARKVSLPYRTCSSAHLRGDLSAAFTGLRGCGSSVFASPGGRRGAPGSAHSPKPAPQAHAPPPPACPRSSPASRRCAATAPRCRSDSAASPCPGPRPHHRDEVVDLLRQPARSHPLNRPTRPPQLELQLGAHVPAVLWSSGRAPRPAAAARESSGSAGRTELTTPQLFAPGAHRRRDSSCVVTEVNAEAGHGLSVSSTSGTRHAGHSRRPLLPIPVLGLPMELLQLPERKAAMSAAEVRIRHLTDARERYGSFSDSHRFSPATDAPLTMGGFG